MVKGTKSFINFEMSEPSISATAIGLLLKELALFNRGTGHVARNATDDERGIYPATAFPVPEVGLVVGNVTSASDKWKPLPRFH